MERAATDGRSREPDLDTVVITLAAEEALQHGQPHERMGGVIVCSQCEEGPHDLPHERMEVVVVRSQLGAVRSDEDDHGQPHGRMGGDDLRLSYLGSKGVRVWRITLKGVCAKMKKIRQLTTKLFPSRSSVTTAAPRRQEGWTKGFIFLGAQEDL